MPFSKNSKIRQNLDSKISFFFLLLIQKKMKSLLFSVDSSFTIVINEAGRPKSYNTTSTYHPYPSIVPLFLTLAFERVITITNPEN